MTAPSVPPAAAASPPVSPVALAVPEPLPQDHPLWDAKNLVLTPHVAGNMSLGYTCDKAVDMFCEDLARYAAGEPLAHLVDRTRGY